MGLTRRAVVLGKIQTAENTPATPSKYLTASWFLTLTGTRTLRRLRGTFYEILFRPYLTEAAAS